MISKKTMVGFMLAMLVVMAVNVNNVSAATMTYSLNWVSYAVTITNSCSDTDYINKNSLTVYDKSFGEGNILASKTSSESYAPAYTTLSKTSTKSAHAKYYAKYNGVVRISRTITKNKGENA